MDKIRVMIIDDERHARRELERAITAYPELELIATASNADEAEALIKTLLPDLIFLDIQMPERSGFALLEALNDVPEVVFVTAYDQYALQAFEFNAFDYLLKPFREERFAKMMDKLREKLLLKKEPRLFIRDGKRCFFVQLNEVYLIDSMDNYARLHFKEHRAMLKSSLNQLEEKLDADVFFRANRSQIINVNYIRNLQSLAGGKILLQLMNHQQVEMSERQSVKFKQRNSL